MKKFGLLIFLIAAFAFNVDAQKSPRKTAKETINGVNIEVDYGAPSVKGRKIWGGLEAYGKVWRAGANQNTTISFSKDVTVDGKALPAGKYGFFVIPNENGEWVAIFSKTNDAWGAYSYKKADDALRVNVTTKMVDKNQEMLNFYVNDASIDFAWEKARFSIPFRVK